MKKRLGAFLSIMMLICGLQTAVGQTTELTLSNTKPQQGEVLSFAFNPEDNGQAYKAFVYSFHPSGFQADDVEIAKNGSSYDGEFSVLDSATAILVVLQQVGESKKLGYSYQVFADEKPVSGSYAALAQIHNGLGESFADIKRDPKKAIALYHDEFAHFPANKDKFFAGYIGVLVGDEQLEAATALTKQRADALFSSEESKESDLYVVANAYANYLKDKPTADSLSAIILERFPEGAIASGKALEQFRAEKDYAKKAELYQAHLAKYADKRPASTFQSWHITMVQAAMQAKDYPKFEEYLGKVESKSTQASLLNQVAWPLAEKGEELEVASKLSKKSLGLLTDIIDDPLGTRASFSFYPPSELKSQAERNYKMNADTYALIQYKQGKLDEALKYQRLAVGDYNGAEVNERFVQFLKESDLDDEAQAAAAKSIEKGQSTAALKGYLKEIYLGKGNDEQAWESYLSGLEANYLAEARKKLIAELIDEEAPDFSLVNMDGEEVSSESLKGKIYVVDFWATWCGPCKASFPGMQLAVDKFEDRDDVQFLFVNTWENIPERETAVKKFIADNNYTFNVLFDTVEGEGNKFDVVGAYEVSGIPTKFIVDRNGRIRFKAVGFTGSAEAELQKVSLMIELADNPPATAMR